MYAVPRDKQMPTLKEDRAIDPVLTELLSRYPDAKLPDGWIDQMLERVLARLRER